MITYDRTSEADGGHNRHPGPYVVHGLARYIERSGERPMAIAWEPDEEMAAGLFRRASVGGKPRKAISTTCS